MKGSISSFGNNRGGRSIANRLRPEVVSLYDPNWVFADAKEGRARTLATSVRERFPEIRPRPLQMQAQEALAHTGEANTLVLSLDTLSATRETVAARGTAQTAIYQIVGQGPGGSAGVRTGIQGTILLGDDAAAEKADLLLGGLDALTQEASSKALTRNDPTTAITMKPMRDLVTRQTVRHLAEKGREPADLSRGPLSAVFGQQVYPLLPVRSSPQDRFRHQVGTALEAAGTVPEWHLAERHLNRYAVVAVVVQERRIVHFFRIAQSRTGKRRVEGVTTFRPPLEELKPADVPVVRPMAAVFTD